MSKTDLQIVQEILNYVGPNENYRNWYAGIATDPKARLFSDHNVTEHGWGWIWSAAINVEHARNAEKILHAKGFDGDSGGGDNPIYVYAYKKTSTTRE